MQKELKHLLAFESSCDETSVALLRTSSEWVKPELLSFSVQSQFDVHEKYGGVVPELASRAHIRNLLPCVNKVLSESGLSMEDVDLFAATNEPGLIGCLLIGHTAAKALSFLYEKPFISCHHIEGHLLSAHIENEIKFPYLALVVSGGHSSLYVVTDWDEFECIGLALDDAAGEAFDKGAKLLELGFPGGPALDKLAQSGDSSTYPFGAVKVSGFNFSFSGLKSELARLVTKEGKNIERASAAASYQKAIVDHLIAKTVKALNTYSLDRLVIVGGVACNSELRKRLQVMKEMSEIKDWVAPSPKFCTDNAAMIGMVAHRKYLSGQFSDLLSDVQSTFRPPIKEIRKLKYRA